jgi:hypothetical protein
MRRRSSSTTTSCAARGVWRSEGKTLGQNVFELVRGGLRQAAPHRRRSGVPVFDVPDGTPVLTPEIVREALEEAG